MWCLKRKNEVLFPNKINHFKNESFFFLKTDDLKHVILIFKTQTTKRFLDYSNITTWKCYLLWRLWQFTTTNYYSIRMTVHITFHASTIQTNDIWIFFGLLKCWNQNCNHKVFLFPRDNNNSIKIIWNTLETNDTIIKLIRIRDRL